MRCINLKRDYGTTYRVRGEDGKTAPTDPWEHVIECKHGHIAPWGGKLLVACTDKCGKIAKLLRALGTVVQDGDDGVNVVFTLERFGEVADLMRARKRRQMSAEQRAAASIRLAQYRKAG